MGTKKNKWPLLERETSSIESAVIIPITKSLEEDQLQLPTTESEESFTVVFLEDRD